CLALAVSLQTLCDHRVLLSFPTRRSSDLALKYEDLSPAAIEAAKLFWFDSIGCALGGSQQDDAKILLKHYRAMSATADSNQNNLDRKSTRLNSSHQIISYAVFCLKKKKNK